MQCYITLGSMVPELHAMRVVCLLKAVTPRMGYEYVSILVSNRLRSSFPLV